MKIIVSLLALLSVAATVRVELYKLGNTQTFTLATVQQPNHKVYFESSPTPLGPWNTFSQWTICDGTGGWLIMQVPNTHTNNKYFRARQQPCN